MRRAGNESSGDTPIFTSTSRAGGGFPWYTLVAFFVVVTALAAGGDRVRVVAVVVVIWIVFLSVVHLAVRRRGKRA
jgi:L-asparagine transporter-like permease